MSWMAITEGARGVFYWSYGLRGLDWGTRDPVLRQQRYDELVNVTKGISALEPVLLAPDSPVLSANSASGTIITKEKNMSGGSRYLFRTITATAPSRQASLCSDPLTRYPWSVARIVRSHPTRAARNSRTPTHHFRLTFTK